MHSDRLAKVVSNYPQAFIDAFANLLNAALYFQGLTILIAQEDIDQDVLEKHSLVVTRSCKLSSLFDHNHDDEDVNEISSIS